MPAVVIGLYADCVFLARSGSAREGESKGEESNGGDSSGVGETGSSEAGWMPIAEGKLVGKGVISTSAAGLSIEGRSMGEGKASSLRRVISTLRLVCLSSSVS